MNDGERPSSNAISLAHFHTLIGVSKTNSGFVVTYTISTMAFSVKVIFLVLLNCRTYIDILYNSDNGSVAAVSSFGSC